MKEIRKLLTIAVFVLPVLGPGCENGEGDGGYQPCTRPPSAPCSPSPPANATNVPTDTDLSWSCGKSQCALPVTYDVHLGTYFPLSSIGSTGGNTCDLGRLDQNTLYHWKVVARDAYGSTESPVFHFTTGEHSCVLPPTAPCQPSPSDGAGGVQIGNTLLWRCGDSQCGLPVTYDVYFGTRYPPPKVATVTQKGYDPSLGYSTRYHWKIVARDDNGSTASPEWEFITAQQEVEVLSSYLNLRINEENDNGRALSVHQCSGSWDEGSLTWRNAPPWRSQVLDKGRRYAKADGSTWMQFSIPRYQIEEWVSAPMFNHGFVVDDGLRTYPGYDTCTEFYTKEKKGTCFNPDPYLEITWRPPGGKVRVITLYPTDDTWAYEAAPDARRGTRSTMWAGWGTWGSQAVVGKARIYIKFDVHLP